VRLDNDETAALPSNQDLVVFIHQAAAENRIAGKYINSVCEDLSGRNNRRLFIVTVRGSNHNARLDRMARLETPKQFWGSNYKVLHFEITRNPKYADGRQMWRRDNDVLYDGVVDFLRPKLTWYFPEPTLLHLERPSQFFDLFTGFAANTMLETGTPTDQDLVIYFIDTTTRGENYTKEKAAALLMDNAHRNKQMLLVFVQQNEDQSKRLNPIRTSFLDELWATRVMCVQLEYHKDARDIATPKFSLRWNESNRDVLQEICKFVSRIPSVDRSFYRRRGLPIPTLTWFYLSGSIACIPRMESWGLNFDDEDVTACPNTPCNRDVVCFFYETGEIRTEWNFIKGLVSEILAKGNKKVICALTRRHVLDDDGQFYPARPLIIQESFKDGRVLQVEFEFQRLLGGREIWHNLPQRTTDSIAAFLRA